MEYTVRKYRESDREAVRRICADTAVLGKPVGLVFDDRDIASDVLVSYYTDFEPEACFVAAAEGRVVGYLAGSLDSARRRRAFLLKIIPSALAKAFSRKVFLRKKTLILCRSFIKSLLAGEFSGPAFSMDYPAVMHINIERGFRGRGAGAGLIEEFFKYLRQRNVKAVMLETKSADAAGFFAGRGFKVLYARRISCMEACGAPAERRFVLGRRV